MTTLARLIEREADVPQATVWYLAEVAEARGCQRLWEKEFGRQLAVLRERAIAESARSSPRVERAIAGESGGGWTDAEVRGYRLARNEIDDRAADLSLSEETIVRLHALCRGGASDAGRYGQQPIDVTDPDGAGSIRLALVDAADVPAAIAQIVDDWNRCLAGRLVHPLIALAAFNLDFLCIHPFQHGNGRVSRLLWLLQTRHLGYEVGRWISLERLVEDTRDRYEETLRRSSDGWHEGTNDPWPYVNYVLATMRAAYGEVADALA